MFGFEKDFTVKIEKENYEENFGPPVADFFTDFSLMTESYYFLFHYIESTQKDDSLR